MIKRNIQYLFAPYNVPVSQTIRGFKVNGIESLFLNCDTNPNCMFIFWSIQTSPNKTNGDFCVTSLMNSSLDYKFKIPEQFFNSLQINMGGCGCWTLSLNWRNYFGAALITLAMTFIMGFKLIDAKREKQMKKNGLFRLRLWAASSDMDKPTHEPCSPSPIGCPHTASRTTLHTSWLAMSGHKMSQIACGSSALPSPF